MNRISLIYTYYENPLMLKEQRKVWDSYGHLRGEVEIILVDDCSWSEEAESEPVLVPFRLFRMDHKIKWNQDGCRNLAATVAAHPWLFVLAMDHVLAASELERLLAADLKPGTYYNPSRVLTDGRPYHPASDVYLMAKTDYEGLGGYDEDFCGYYGTDGEFHRRARERLKCEARPETVTLFTREDVPDASTTEWERKSEFDKGALAALRWIKQEYRLPPRRGRVSATRIL